jgi:hypothetical protein
MADPQQTTDGGVDLHLRRELAVPVATLIRNHITEVPQQFRQELQQSISGWTGGEGSNMGQQGGQRGALNTEGGGERSTR